MRATGHVAVGKGAVGIERLEAWLFRETFARHRHDTYAIGVTLSGVQAFRYRGAQRYCLPKQCHILHPDEEHDGASGTDEGFSYRIVYLDPALVQEALGGRPLPYVADPVHEFSPTQMRAFIRLWDLEEEIDELGRVEIAEAATEVLTSASGAPPSARTLPIANLRRVRALIAAEPARRHSLEELERVADLDRWTLARHFRAAFGTSPSRFRTMRQLDRARSLIRQGEPLAGAALDAGFADQSHMTRMFKSAFGLSPSRWAAALA